MTARLANSYRAARRNAVLRPKEGKKGIWLLQNDYRRAPQKKKARSRSLTK